jgi:S-adenosylmethionine synthetase
LLSQIGSPIDDPHVADAHLVTEDGVEMDDIRADVRAAIDDELRNVTDITKRVIDGELETF